MILAYARLKAQSKNVGMPVKYASLHGACQTLISQAHLQCKRAYEWTLQVISRFRSSQLHLEGNLPAKEVSFKQFDPSGKVSVYEFLTLYEEWARGYISDAAKARLLFSKYLSPTITEGFEEIKLPKHDYNSMKTWLIDNFGSVKGVADTQLKAIKSLKAPRSGSEQPWPSTVSAQCTPAPDDPV